jgi:UDP-glucose 4-epimerase
MLMSTENAYGNNKFIAALVLKLAEGNQYEKFGVIEYMNVVSAAQDLSMTPRTDPMDQSYLQSMTGFERRSIWLVRCSLD